jgi:hypothetical protein
MNLSFDRLPEKKNGTLRASSTSVNPIGSSLEHSANTAAMWGDMDT